MFRLKSNYLFVAFKIKFNILCIFYTTISAGNQLF